MNPQPYYQYQMAVPGVQGVPTHPQNGTYLTSLASGGIHVATVPPPPPSASATAANVAFHQTKVATPLTQPPAVEQSKDLDKSVPSQATATNEEAESGNDSVTAAPNTEISRKVLLTTASLTCSTATIASAGANTIPTPVPVQPSLQTSWVGGVYAGAYLQQAVPQQSTPIAPTQPQYVMTPAGLQPSVQGTQGSKLVYLPHNYVAGLNGTQMLPQGGMVSPTVVTDSTGKTYIVNGAYQPHLQYPVPQANAVKVSTVE
ncbi:unnamed protein product [Clavelina lepadiformis]|uniref:Uncharacterized protein n=1 Tax=Clavelina lepadiformis TaxID=159417 RepID=A0ABP0GJX4_CLALP